MAINRSVKKLIFTVIIAALSISLFPAQANAEIATQVSVNSIGLLTDSPPFILNDYTYVPFRAIAESLGCDVGYDDATQTVTITGHGITLSLTIDSRQAVVNGKPVTMAAPAVVVNDRTMVPVRFVCETFKSEVRWQEGYESEYGVSDNKVMIYSEFPSTVKPLGVGVSSRCFSYYSALGQNPYYDYEQSVSYDYIIPQFSGMGDASYQAVLNAQMLAKYLNADTEARENEREQRADAQGLDESDVYYYTYSNELSYRVSGVRGNILEITLESYEYLGGAHGMPFIYTYNIDTARSKTLQLGDLFTNASYKQTLINKMNAIRLKGGEDMEYVEEVVELPPDNSFYFTDDALIIYYEPYELASYARGFVEFSVPLSELSGILRDEYK